MIKRPIFFTLILLLTFHSTTRTNWILKTGGAFGAYYFYQVQQQNNQMLRNISNKEGIKTPTQVTVLQLACDGLGWAAEHAIELVTGTSPNKDKKEETSGDDVEAVVLEVLKKLANANKNS